MNTISREQWANPNPGLFHHCQCLPQGKEHLKEELGLHRWRSRRQRVNLGKEGALPWEQRSERLQCSEGTSCSHSKGQWWGRRDAGVTTSSSAGCPSGSESGHVGSLFPIIVRAKGVYPVCSGSWSTGTLCPAGTHLQLQA